MPLFALANAGVHIDGAFLAHAVSAPIVLGIVIGYLAGKPVGLFLGSWLATKLSRGAVRPPIGWAALAGGGSIAGIGFTVSLLIAGVAFRGEQLDEAKLGVLTAALGGSLLTWLVFRGTALLPSPMRARALFGTAKTVVNLAVPVEPERDRLRGPRTAPVTLVEYGDFECPFCGRAEPVIRELLRDSGDRYVWRHRAGSQPHPCDGRSLCGGLPRLRRGVRFGTPPITSTVGSVPRSVVAARRRATISSRRSPRRRKPAERRPPGRCPARVLPRDGAID